MCKYIAGKCWYNSRIWPILTTQFQWANLDMQKFDCHFEIDIE